MYETLQESFLGQLIYRGSGRRLFKYPEEKPGFEVPIKYRRDEKSKALLASHAKRVAARKEAREQYGKIQKQREEKPIRIAPPEPAPRGGEEAYVDAAERRAIKQEHRDERPVRLGDDLESGRRISGGSDATQVDPEEGILGLDEDEDPNLVTWYGPDDPANPQNWGRFKKFHVTFCICLITIAVYTGSSIISPGIMEIMQEFGVAQVPATLGLSLFVIGYGTGPLVWAPLTEIPAIGRNPPYILTLIVFVVLQVPTALVRNFAGLLVLRFLAGFFGSPPLATGGASLQDMYDIKTRTYALGIWGIAASGGPAIGPVIAGFAAQYKGWRWQFWELLWLSGGALAFLIFLMPETSSQNILVRRAQRLRRLTGDKDIKSEGEIEQAKMTASQAAKMTLVKPLVLNFTEAMVFASNLFIGFVYAVLYSWFESFPLVYAEMYGMSLSISELPFLGLLVGAVVGFFGFAAWHKYYWCRKFDRLDGAIQPEERLWPAIVGAACLPICLFWFGWSSGRTHWICPTIASGFFGIGAICLFNPIINFLTDGYKPDQTASVLAANDFVRSMIGGAMPLVAHGLFVNLKVDWGCSLLGFISLGFLPLPILLIKLGPWLRQRSPRAISPEEIGSS